MKLLGTTLVALATGWRQENLERNPDKCLPLKVPESAKGVNCKLSSCKLVCPPEKVPYGKRKTFCKYIKNKDAYWWKPKLEGCVGCDEPPEAKWANVQCKRPDKGAGVSCAYTCKNGNSMDLEGEGDEFSDKLILKCLCPKDKKTKKRKCRWTFKSWGKEAIDSETLSLVQCSGPPIQTTEIPETKTLKPITTLKPIKTTTAKPDKTTTETITKPTIGPTSGPTIGPVGEDCKPNADGSCGDAPPIEVYLAADFESMNTILMDPHLCHLDHIGRRAFVGVGAGMDKLTRKGARDALAIRVDQCEDLTKYEDPLNTMLQPPKGETTDCASTYTWVWRSDREGGNHEQFGMVATSPDREYVIAAGVRQTAAGHSRWLVKLNALTGTEIWNVVMPNSEEGMSKNSGYESVAFAPDGSLIVGGYARRESSTVPTYKSGGQVDDGIPIIQKFSKEFVESDSKPTSTKPVWTYVFEEKERQGELFKGSVKTLRTTTGSGHTQVVGAAGGNAIIVLDHSEGSKTQSLRVDLNDMDIQDVEPVYDEGRVSGFVTTGLQTIRIKKGEQGCIDPEGCSGIVGHVTMFDHEMQLKWTRSFNDFYGGTEEYADLDSLSNAVVLTECWGVSTSMEASGMRTKNIYAACGQGIEGCKEYLTGIDPEMLAICEKDPRRTWRGLAIAFSMDGDMKWYRNDNHRAYEFVDVGPDGKPVFVSDKPIGFGFASYSN